MKKGVETWGVSISNSELHHIDDGFGFMHDMFSNFRWKTGRGSLVYIVVHWWMSNWRTLVSSDQWCVLISLVSDHCNYYCLYPVTAPQYHQLWGVSQPSMGKNIPNPLPARVPTTTTLLTTSLWGTALKYQWFRVGGDVLCINITVCFRVGALVTDVMDCWYN